MEKSYMRFELLRYYYTAYKLYRLERKKLKYETLAKKYEDDYKMLNLAMHSGFYSAKKFTQTLIDIKNSQVGKNRLQNLAGIK